MRKNFACRPIPALLQLALITGILIPPSTLAEGVSPTFYEGFDKGPIDGPVGKAGNSLSRDGRGIVDMDRGTMAFFYQSKTAPQETEWGVLGGISTGRDSGYWGMAAQFDLRRDEFLFNFHDVGFYAPPLKLPSIFGRWKAGEWHHLAAVWDRIEGITVYEDGRRVNSNWGKHRWEWNFVPEEFAISGPVDEVYLFAECLTDAQIAQLAKGEKPTGDPIPITPADQRRLADLERMGWTGDDLANLPAISPGVPQQFIFARVQGCTDAKRPVACPYQGLLRTTWPSVKYGPSIRGQRLEIRLAPNPAYDRIRIFVHRPLQGELVRISNGDEVKAINLDAPRAMFWHRRLPQMLRDTNLVLRRTYGQVGQIDFYRVDALNPSDRPQTTEVYQFEKAESFPDTEQAKVILGEVPRRFWQPISAVPREVPSWTLKTHPFGGFQALTDLPQDAKAYDGALIALAVEALAEPTPIRIEVREPVDPERVWLAMDAVLQPGGTGTARYEVLLKGRPVINLPTMQKLKYTGNARYSDERLPVPGVGFTVQVTSAQTMTWLLGQGGTRVQFVPADMASSLPAATDDQVEWMREAYAECMEGHLYGWKRLQTPLTWLARFAPHRMEFRQMWERLDYQKPNLVGVTVEPLVYKEPENTTGAPEWAFWQQELMNLHRKHMHWIIDNKQVWTGEFGGVWNDDADEVENWMGYMLCMDGDGKIRDAVHRYWDGVWTHQLTEGVGKYTQDTCHFAEEGSSSIGMRLLIDYGDPIAYARTMAATSHYPKWVTENKDGTYLVKSMWVGPQGAWTEGAFRIDKPAVGHLWDVFISSGYLIWYNRHPEAAKLIRGLKPNDPAQPFASHGLLGPAADRLSDWDEVLKRYAENAVKPLDRYGPDAHIRWINEIGLTDEIRKAHAVEYKPIGPIAHYWGSRDTDRHWFSWKMSGDIRFLVDSYKRTCAWFYSHDWLNAGAMPSMDRCPLPRGALIRSRIGSLAANRGGSGITWPQHALSYTRGGDQVAALVTENIPNRLTVRLYPFPATPHELQIRTWRCHGTFRVTLANDRNDDGVPEDTIQEREMKLDRGAFIDLTLPPRQASILSVTPIRPETPNYDRPDPAISLNSVELVYGDHLVVHVYNNGTKPVDDVLVRVRDARSGEIVVSGEAHTGPLEAPLDLKPRFKTVEFKNINCNTHGTILIELDPDHRIDDLNPYNNRVVLRYRSTYDATGGWK